MSLLLLSRWRGCEFVAIVWLFFFRVGGGVVSLLLLFGCSFLE